MFLHHILCNVENDEAAKRRKARRLYLNIKRLNKISSHTQSILTSSTKNKENINPNTTFTLNRSSFSVLSSINVSSTLSKFNSGNCPSSTFRIKEITSISPSTFTNLGNIASSSGILTNITSNSSSTSSVDIIPSSSSRISPNTVLASDNVSTLTKISSGKRKLVRRRRDLTPIPIIDLTADDDNEVPKIINQHLKGVSKDYLDNGDQIIVCGSCNAKIWKAEADRGKKREVKLSGQNYHNIGSLLPDDGDEPKFSQLYIYDTDNEIFNRQNDVGGSNTSFSITEKAFDFQIIEELKVMLDTNNALVKSCRQARNCLNENPYIDLKLRLIGKRAKDGRTYNLPEASEVAALVIGDFTQVVENRDIVVKTKSGRLERISELHPSYLSHNTLFYFHMEKICTGLTFFIEV
ncbi:uncharacterized protein LOC110893308 [Helianthus annuus]|uniref:uncharacterized protein LOC110893308 n=1 Tax=Helianthus annuus TaxID=4232 RepID=UPI000B905961|nr:uncharacterized protein LOC110893308 [Helianthus annuus]